MKCSECKFGEPIYDTVGELYFWCKACRCIVEESTAENNNLYCDCYVADLDVDD